MSDQKLSWGNIQEQASELGISSGGNYFRFEDGENIIRILSLPVHTAQYFLGKGIAPVYEQNADDNLKSNKDARLVHRFVCYVYNVNLKRIQIAELGWSIVKQIDELSKSSQYGYDRIPPYDLIITKTGSGMNTEYKVTPGRDDKPLDEKLTKEIEGMKSIEDYVKEQIQNPNATEEELDKKKQ